MKRELPAAPAEGDVLQRALAALVADRAVERVVDQQELDDRPLRVACALGLRVDDHAVLDRGRAGGLELGDALDLDQAHAAGADRLAELGLVAEDRDLDVAELGGVGEHHVLGRLDLAAVDLEGDRAGARGAASTATRPRGEPARLPCAPRTRRGTSRSSSRSASPSRRPARTGSCR